MTKLSDEQLQRIGGTFFLVLSMGAASYSANASELTTPNTFVAGTTAVAAEVNANFAAVEGAVDDNNARIAALEAQVQALEDLVETLQAGIVPNLGNYLRIDETDPLAPIAWFEAVNVKIVNGLGTTTSINGLGNLIVGYDEPRLGGSSKDGSHNLVVGPEHNYESTGGLVAGFSNTTSAPNASVTGGMRNTASGSYSSISGGADNEAIGQASSVSGGGGDDVENPGKPQGNKAIGDYSSVTGGTNNWAQGESSSVAGGAENRALGRLSAIAGGDTNTASGYQATIVGGLNGVASGIDSSVAGGNRNTASGARSSVSGGRQNEASGANATVSGGFSNTAATDDELVP